MTNFNLSDDGVVDGPIGATQSVVVFVLHLLIVLIGVPGNILILAVFWVKPRRTSTAVLIMALAGADLAACLARVLDVVHQGIQLAGVGPLFGVYEAITVANNVSMTVVAAVTAVIALDRYDCVCRHNKRLLTHRRSLTAVVVICCLSVLSNIPLFVHLSGVDSWSTVVFAKQVIFYSLDVLVVVICYARVYAAIRQHARVGVPQVRIANPASESESFRSGKPVSDTSQKGSKQAPANVCDIADAETPCCSSNTAVTVLSSRVSFEPTTPYSSFPIAPKPPEATKSGTLRATETVRPGGSPRTADGEPPPHGTKRTRSSSNRAGPPALFQRRTTRMLFLATLIFLLTWIPYWIFVGLQLSGRPKDVFYKIMLDLLNIMFVNNAVNPLIYGLANRRFRKDVSDVFRKTCGRKSSTSEFN